MVNSPAENQLKTKRIVYAENDRLLLEAIGDVLRSKGYEVILAKDGLEALLAIRETRPDCVILDIVMPKLDGSRVCWLMRQDPALRNIGVIAFSSLSGHDFGRFPGLSADAYVAKGPLQVAAKNLLDAIAYLEKGRTGLNVDGGLFGYEGMRSRQIVKEILNETQRTVSILRSFGLGVFELDQDGRILMVNQVACDLCGKSEPQLIGLELTALCDPECRNAIQGLIRELAQASEPTECFAAISINKKRVSLRVSPIIESRSCTGIAVMAEGASR